MDSFFDLSIRANQRRAEKLKRKRKTILRHFFRILSKKDEINIEIDTFFRTINLGFATLS